METGVALRKLESIDKKIKDMIELHKSFYADTKVFTHNIMTRLDPLFNEISWFFKESAKQINWLAGKYKEENRADVTNYESIWRFNAINSSYFMCEMKLKTLHMEVESFTDYRENTLQHYFDKLNKHINEVRTEIRSLDKRFKDKESNHQ